MKAAYRLFAQEVVTHQAICQPHWDQTRALASDCEMVFLVQNTTEFSVYAPPPDAALHL